MSRPMSSKRRALLGMLLCGLCACQGPVTRFDDGEATQEISTEEQRLWLAADQFDQNLELGGYLYKDPAIQAYMQAILDKLYPQYKGVMRVRVNNAPSLNAFALPNGSIYINTGMLARLENEAQVATVLAHEGAHFIMRHGWQQNRNTKTTAAVSLSLGLLTGVPALSQLAAVSSIYGFSRELEREADAIGFARLKAAGYDVEESYATFEYLLEEVKALDIDEPFFFSSHPRLTERIESFKALSAESAGEGGYTGEADYKRVAALLKIETLRAYLAMGRYQSVFIMLDEAKELATYPAYAPFFLGEAYRLRDQDGDKPLAEAAYLKAIERSPQFADAHRALGIYYMKENEAVKARAYFDTYLHLAPEAADRAYIEQYRKSLEP